MGGGSRRDDCFRPFDCTGRGGRGVKAAKSDGSKPIVRRAWRDDGAGFRRQLAGSAKREMLNGLKPVEAIGGGSSIWFGRWWRGSGRTGRFDLRRARFQRRSARSLQRQ